MNKSLLLALSATMFSSAAFAHDGSHRLQCDESGCRIEERGSYRPTTRRYNNNRPHSGYRGAECADGECCIDGQCDVSSGPGAHDCRDGSCDTGFGYEPRHRQNLRPDFGTNDVVQNYRRLDNPFRPAARNQRRFDNQRRQFIPTGYEARRPVQRGIQWESSIRSAVDQAQSAGLPIVVQVSAPWCPHCQRMKQESWTDPQLMGLVSQQYVAVEVNADEQRDFIRQMRIQSLPTTLIVAPDLKILNRAKGFQSAQQLLQLMSR